MVGGALTGRARNACDSEQVIAAPRSWPCLATENAQMAYAALRLAERPGCGTSGGGVHMLGFRGHFVTKPRRYSTKLGELRATRAAYRARQDEQPEDDEVNDDDSTVVLSVWQYLGSGYLNPRRCAPGSRRRGIPSGRPSSAARSCAVGRRNNGPAQHRTRVQG
jgi:hypothetical protein